MAERKINNKDSQLCVLIILDGWGVAEAGPGNAITAANTPVFDDLTENYPACTLISRASARLDSKTETSSETGHFLLGTGQKDIEERKAPKQNLGEVIAAAKLKQVRIAETEKFAHVTHFFNGYKEKAALEDHILIPSEQVKSYDLSPGMSADMIARKAINFLGNEAYKFYVINFANADMVAHTGEFKAAVRAVEKVDEILGEIIEAVITKAGTAVICADHGNAEAMFAPGSGKINNKHTNSAVPFIIINDKYKGHSLGWPDVIDNDLSLIKPQGTLLDVAPTIIDLLGLNKPSEMEGKSLL